MKLSRNRLQLPASILLLILCALHIESIMQGVEQALTICAFSIIPSLFLFLVLSDWIVSILLSENRIPSVKYTIFLLGALCGFPTGAVVCDRLYQAGTLSEKDVNRMLPICNNVSPAFALGSIGVSMFQDIRLGILIYLSTSVASFLFLLPLKIYAAGFKKQPDARTLAEMFFTAVEKSVGSILRICALICICSALLSIVANYCSDTVYRVFASILEIGSGSSAITPFFTKHPLLTVSACSFICAWSGICVHLQIFSVSKSVKVNKLIFTLKKLFLGICSAALTWIGYKLFFYT